MNRFANATALVLLFTSPLRAQDREADPRAVQPERPTVATHAHTVAPGYVEMEAGVEGDRAGAGERAWSVLSVTKIGLTSRMQLNVSTPAVVSGPGQSWGIGDVSVGVKWRLLDDHAVLGNFALLPAIKLPTGSTAKGAGSGTLDVEVTAIASYDLHRVSMDLNAAYTRIGGEGSAAPSSAALWTASFGFPMIGRLSWVAELFGQPTIDHSGAASTAALLTGPTYLVSTALNLDAGVIAPFHGDMRNAVYAGLVWNVGSIARHHERPAQSHAR